MGILCTLPMTCGTISATELFQDVVGDAVLVVVVLDGGLDGLLRQHGAVELVRGQTVQGVDDLLVGQLQRVFERACP